MTAVFPPPAPGLGLRGDAVRTQVCGCPGGGAGCAVPRGLRAQDQGCGDRCSCWSFGLISTRRRRSVAGNGTSASCDVSCVSGCQAPKALSLQGRWLPCNGPSGPRGVGHDVSRPRGPSSRGGRGGEDAAEGGRGDGPAHACARAPGPGPSERPPRGCGRSLLPSGRWGTLASESLWKEPDACSPHRARVLRKPERPAAPARFLSVVTTAVVLPPPVPTSPRGAARAGLRAGAS